MIPATCSVHYAGFCLRMAFRCWVIALMVHACSSTVKAQINNGYYHPINQHMPPGQAAAWLNAARGYNPSWVQPVRIELPTEGQVGIYSASSDPTGILPSPAQFGVNAGHVYRLRIADMPEFPGEEVFPSIEILDHLHPPVGQENDFPIPIVFSKDDLRLAIDGKMVTRVIYLEQPQLAQTLDPLRREVPQSVLPRDNALQEADRLGRPLVIVRIGGRVPGPGVAPSFFGTGGAVDLRPVQTPVKDATVRRESNRTIRLTDAR